MSYSVPTWDGTATPLGEERGWLLNRWEAVVNNTITEPHPDNTDWLLVTPVSLTGVTLQVIPDPIDYLQTRVTSITLTQEHISRPPEVYLGGVTVREYIFVPDIPSIITPTYITNIRVYTNNLKGRQLNTENKLTSNL